MGELYVIHQKNENLMNTRKLGMSSIGLVVAILGSGSFFLLYRVAMPERAVGNFNINYTVDQGIGSCTKQWAGDCHKCPTVLQNNLAHSDVVAQAQDHLMTRYPAQWLYPDKILRIYETALLTLSITVGLSLVLRLPSSLRPWWDDFRRIHSSGLVNKSQTRIEALLFKDEKIETK